jgi:hypothetical protein
MQQTGGLAMLNVLWLVGQFKAETEQGIAWEFIGVFETRELAVAACTSENQCVQSVRLNERRPDKTETFPDSFYPLLEQAAAS